MRSADAMTGCGDHTILGCSSPPARSKPAESVQTFRRADRSRSRRRDPVQAWRYNAQSTSIHPRAAIHSGPSRRATSLCPEPACEPFDTPVSAGGASDDEIQVKQECMLDEGARYIERQAVATESSGVSSPENGGSFRYARSAEATAAAKSGQIGREDADLEISTRVFVLPGQEAVEKVMRPPVIVAEAIGSPISRVHLVCDESPPVRPAKVAEHEPWRLNEHDCHASQPHLTCGALLSRPCRVSTSAPSGSAHF